MAGGAVASVAVVASPDPVVVGVCAGETDVSVGVDAVPPGPVTPDGSSEPQAASAAVRASARTTLNRVTYLVVRVRVIFFPSRSYWRHSQHMLGAPSGRYAVRPRLRARGFSRRAGRQGQSGPTGLPGCLARTRSSRCRGGSANSGWRGCPAPPVSLPGKPRAIPADSREVARLGLNSWPVV